jgi:TrpR family transcriptional regulator, trp operon repressor
MSLEGNLTQMEKFNDGWQQLLYWCRHSENEQQLGGLFDLLLTPEEKNDIAMRCLIICELLTKKHTQRDISKNISVSIAKITRGSNELKRIDPLVLKNIESNLL